MQWREKRSHPVYAAKAEFLEQIHRNKGAVHFEDPGALTTIQLLI